MKKKTVRIILIVVGILMVIVVGSGIFMYNFTQGSEKISGKQEAIEGQHSDPVIVDGYVYDYCGNSSDKINRSKEEIDNLPNKGF